MHTTSYNAAHDKAQLLARRHERDLHWAKERRRQHERETAEARALLAIRPLRAAAPTLWASAGALAVTAGAWLAALAALSPSWAVMGDGGAAAVAVVILLVAAASLGRLRARRAAARELLRIRDARLSHTQYHIHESVHSYIGARVDVVNTRESVPA
ncbi:hypothetical protein [Leifsonia sp. SIMBA_070]|uniref:hypothetical protein n=1 Tax=Leifsonia sp. SIMBA_070 TaxID=3085810 RepID=UPI00397950F8